MSFGKTSNGWVKQLGKVIPENARVEYCRVFLALFLSYSCPVLASTIHFDCLKEKSLPTDLRSQGREINRGNE